MSALLLARISEVLCAVRFDVSTEAHCRDGVEGALCEGLPPTVSVDRERALGPRDRPDFIVGGAVVVEVKSRHALASRARRQLGRYAGFPHVTGLVVFAPLDLQLGETIAGKPVVQLLSDQLGHLIEISPACPPPTQAGEGAPGAAVRPCAGGSEDAHAVRLGGAP